MINYYTIVTFDVIYSPETSQESLFTRNNCTIQSKESVTIYLTDPSFVGKEGNTLFNDALNTFYLRLYGVRHMVKDHSDSQKGNPLPPHGLLFSINSKGSFICTIPQTG